MLLAILCTATQTLYAQTFSMASEASSQNTPSGWTAVDLPTGLPEITTANTFDITTYGAFTSSSDNTTAIQAALDAAASAGGGMVVIPAGEWMFGRIQVGAKTILHLSAGATLKLLAYSDQPDHTIKTPYITNKSNATDIVIEGESKSTSIIEGQGGPWWDAVESNESGLQRGSMIRFTSGSRFLFRNFRIQNAPGTNLTLGNSGKGTHNTVHDISIYAPSSHASDPSHNTDGIPIWAAYANIYNCDIDTGDDNVVTDSNAQFIHVWNCDMKAGHGASLGSYTVNMHDILFEDLTFTGTDCGFRLKSNRDRSGDVYNITFRNCKMTNVPSPISITSWYDTLPNSPEAAAASPDQLISTTPEFHDILIQNVTVSGHTTYKSSDKNYYGIFIYGRPESKVYDVTFDNVNITHSKGIKMNFCEGIKFYDNCSFKVSNTNNTDKNAVAGDDLENVIEEKYDCAYNWKVETGTSTFDGLPLIVSWNTEPTCTNDNTDCTTTGSANNLATWTDGTTIKIMRSDKGMGNGSNITIGGTSYKTIKVSNGAQNKLTMPAGKYAYAVDIYSYVNKKTHEATETYYWKEVNGTSYTQPTLTCYSDGDLTNPDKASFSLGGVSSFTFNNAGTQLCYVLVISTTPITTQPSDATYGQNETPSALTVEASSSAGTLTYQWYSSSDIDRTNPTLINGATNASYSGFSTSTIGTQYYYCLVTDNNGSYISDVATITIVEAGTIGSNFKDFAVIVNNQTGTLLTPEEQVQGTTVNFGVAVDNSGNTVRVAADDASSIATISGTYHNDHGMTGLKVVVPVPGKVTIQIGTCTYSTNTITVKDSNNETMLSYTPTDDDKNCWKNDHSKIIELSYNGPATTLTITGMNYCPFIAVKKVKSTVEKPIYSTNFSDWSTFSSSTIESNVNKTTNYTDETLTFSIYNTALMSVTDETKFGNYTTIPHNALQAAKATDPYVTTSALGNITKVRYIHGATGSSRGWKLEAKGDGDNDWVTISDSYANPAAWCEVTKDINRTNCQLRFTNLNSSQNAYMFELEIFGEVEIKLYEITGTISGGDINGSTISLTGNGETYTATVADNAFSMNVPAGTYTVSLSNDVPYLLSSPSFVEVSAAGSIGTITIEAASAQTVTGAIANAPTEAFTLTFTGASHTETVNCAANATSFSTTLNPDTYVISSSTGTLSPLSVESFTVVKDAVTHNIYYPEAAVPAATQQNITVDNTLNVASANNYKTVTDALAAAKAGSISAPIITLTSGQTYREQVIVDIADVTFKTSGTEKATITFYYGIGYCYYSLNSKGVYDKDRAMTRNSIIKRDPERWGATVKVTRNGKNFKAENIIFENSFNQYYTQEEIIDGVQPNGVQSITYDRTLTANESGYKAADSKAVTERAAAIAFEGDPKGCQLYNCEFRGSQDTFYTGSSNTLYVKDCNIIGNTDYIFGGGYVVFDNCDLTIGGYSDQEATAYITANSPNEGEYYIFRDCTVKAYGRQYTAANLGRDWGGDKVGVVYFNLNNELGNKMSYTWTNMGGAISAGTANLHIYDFDPAINANYTTTGSTGANVNGLLSDEDALDLYANVVTRLGFTPEHIYDDDVVLDEGSYYNVCRIAATDNVERNVKLTRAIPADRWNTIVLPFDLTADQITATFGKGTKVAELADGDAEDLKFASVTEMTANQPYAIKVPAAITVNTPKTISGVTVKNESPMQTVGGWQFTGTYTKGNIPTGSYFFSNNQLWQAADDTNTIKPFRAWLTYNGANASRELSFTIDDETTSISEELRVKGEESDGVIYDLQGRRVRSAEANSSLFTIHSSLKPGVYIVNGKCVIIK